MTISRTKIKYIVLTAIVIAFTTSFIIWKINKNKLLSNHALTTARITNWETAQKSGNRLEYEFKVDNTIYRGSTRDFELAEFEAESLVGKFFPVVYFPENPNNNQLLYSQEYFSKYNIPQPDSLVKYNSLFK